MMQREINLIFLSSIFFWASISCDQLSNQPMMRQRKPSPEKTPNKIICISIPKCGTYLLTKCVTLLGLPGISGNYLYDPKKYPIKTQAEHDQINQFDPPNHYKGKYHMVDGQLPPSRFLNALQSKHAGLLWDHWLHTSKTEDLFSKNSMAGFFILRDPRDQVVSMAYMIKDGRKSGQKADVKDLIFDLIDGRKKNFIRWGVEIHDAYPLEWDLGVCQFYKLYLPWMKAKKFCAVKFENLVGQQGGGSEVAQIQEIKKIASHVGAALSDQQINAIISNLFGKSGTFREGKIGSWKTHFTPEMKDAFKKAPGACQLLIDLGYEKDDKW